ncbi:MAG: hypothetical protein ACJAS7_000863 [Alpinimonas sp.]|jgi:hypothetical protein
MPALFEAGERPHHRHGILVGVSHHRGEGEEALHDADRDGGDGAPAVGFEVELA